MDQNVDRPEVSFEEPRRGMNIWLIVAIVVLVLLLCCCLVIILGWLLFAPVTGNVFSNIIQFTPGVP